jgi:hypothetical protein
MCRKVLLVGLVLAMTASMASATLVARYEFQGNYIDSTGDVDGNYQNGTPYGNASIGGMLPAGPQQGYLVLNNVSPAPASYVDIGFFTILDPVPHAFTLAAWILPDIEAAKDKPIVQKGDEFGIKVKSNDTLEVYFQSAVSGGWYGANIPGTRVSQVWADGKFHHVAGTYDPTVAQIKLYVDGVLEATNTFAGTAGWVVGDTIVQDATKNWNIGRDSKNTTRLFTGLIDDVRIYNNALTAAEVKALIPEPATLAMLGLGGLTLLRRNRQ